MLMRKMMVCAAVVVCGAGAAVGQDGTDPFAGMIERGAPNEHHERLSYFVGEWDATMTMRMSAEMSPMPNRFDSTYELVMGGRFLEERVTSESEMGSFEGRGIMGYDNLKGRYVTAWFDNMGTSISGSEGFWDEGGKSFEFQGSGPDMMTGETKPIRFLMELHGKDTFTVREWVYEGDGTRWLRFEAEYRRTE